MINLISPALTSAICEQIGHEIMNANTYLYICGYLRNKGLDGIAKHFEEQHAEEIGHSKEFFSLLTDLNAPVTIPEVDEANSPITTIMDIANIYLERETLTTTSINEIKKLAILEDNSIVEEKMRDMISKQQKEMEEVNNFMDMAILLPEWWMVKLNDN
jgi:ferritin